MNNVTTVSRTVNVLSKPYTRRLTPDETGTYVGTILEFPGCIADGKTPNEAIKNLDRAATVWIASCAAAGHSVREPIAFDGVSGKVALRIPRGLHQQVAELAQLEDCSINQLITAALASYVGKVNMVHRVQKAVKDALPPMQNFFVFHPQWLQSDLTQTSISPSTVSAIQMSSVRHAVVPVMQALEHNYG